MQRSNGSGAAVVPLRRAASAGARWPSALWLVRHGESAGNVARDAAEATGSDRILLSGRDVDVVLSPQGEVQANALGEMFAALDPDRRPEILLASPYVRARDTARIFQAAGGTTSGDPILIDERLREKEFGILDGLTTLGIAAVFPEQSEFRRVLGKFYHRPPGGESWCDVILRLRSLMDTVALHYAGRRVMIVAHQVVVLCLRYIIEEMDEAQILAIDAHADVANCGVTEYRCTGADGPEADGHIGGALEMVRYNSVEHLERDREADVTAEPDRETGARG